MWHPENFLGAVKRMSWVKACCPILHFVGAQVIWNTNEQLHWLQYRIALVLVLRHNPVPWLLHPGGANWLQQDSAWRVCPNGDGLKIGIKMELTLVNGAEASRWLQRKLAVLLLSHLDANIQGRNKEFRFYPNVNSLYHVALLFGT